jgi:oxygen-independent coproporphyrinogen-3 oxidase
VDSPSFFSFINHTCGTRYNPGMSSELGLYIHLPFCASRCPYCDFYALLWRPGPARGLLKAMHKHLERITPQAEGRLLASLYLGGGTPSMWPARDLAGLTEAVQRFIGLEPKAEISLEANPGTLSAAKLKALRSAGVNRLSLGAQSFDQGLLAALGRRHSPAQTVRAFGQAREAGFGNISLDLIQGLPGQSVDLAARDVVQALDLEPEHLSLYELTLSPETIFGQRYAKGQAPLPSEDEMADMEERSLELIQAAGLKRYEVSNFARPGSECRHNHATWCGSDYLALGPGAHGHLEGTRWAWLADAEAYTRAVERGDEPLAFREELPPKSRGLELFMLGLRTPEGVDLAAIDGLVDGRLELIWSRALDEIQDKGWARLEGKRLIPTQQGLSMADAAAALFA